MRVKGEYTNWDEVHGTGTINDKWTLLKENLKSLKDEFIPHRLVGICNRHKRVIPLDEASIRKIKKKHRLRKIYMETREGGITQARNQKSGP